MEMNAEERANILFKVVKNAETLSDSIIGRKVQSPLLVLLIGLCECKETKLVELLTY